MVCSWDYKKAMVDGGWSILENWESVLRCCQRDRLQKDNMQSSFDQLVCFQLHVTET